MAEDASLDDFASTDEHDDEADGDADTESADSDADTELADSGADTDAESEGVESVDGETGDTDTDTESVSADPAAVEPATTTYGWSGEPVACGSCGTAVDRRWRDGDELVCTECKEW